MGVLRARTTSVPERSERISVRGHQLFLRERGEGHPLLLINGLGANTEMWGTAEQRLSQRCRTIVFDAPGAGRSSTPLFPLPISGIAEAALGLLDELGHDRADVLGVSLGGFVAQELAHLAPERVRRLALVSTACGSGGTLGDLASVALIATPLRYYSRAFGQTLEHLYPESDRRVDRQVRSDRLSYPPSLLGYTWQLVAASSWSSVRWLPTLAAPTLVVSGAMDKLLPVANGTQLATLIPKSRLHVLEDEGHLLIFDPASSVHDLLGNFFASRAYERCKAWTSGVAVAELEEAA